MEEQKQYPKIVRVHPNSEVMSRQKLPHFVGISGQTAGSTGLSMNLIVIPPGGAGAPHIHRKFESAVYVMKGRVKMLYGPALRESLECTAGDFFFVPPDLPHQPINLSESEPAYFIAARNDPNEQENVLPYSIDSTE